MWKRWFENSLATCAWCRHPRAAPLIHPRHRLPSAGLTRPSPSAALSAGARRNFDWPGHTFPAIQGNAIRSSEPGRDAETAEKSKSALFSTLRGARGPGKSVALTHFRGGTATTVGNGVKLLYVFMIFGIYCFMRLKTYFKQLQSLSTRDSKRYFKHNPLSYYWNILKKWSYLFCFNFFNTIM